jgi:hypothetical protein
MLFSNEAPIRSSCPVKDSSCGGFPFWWWCRCYWTDAWSQSIHVMAAPDIGMQQRASASVAMTSERDVNNAVSAVCQLIRMFLQCSGRIDTDLQGSFGESP